jgi:SAM-dependent methyltransferase
MRHIFLWYPPEESHRFDPLNHRQTQQEDRTVSTIQEAHLAGDQFRFYSRIYGRLYKLGYHNKRDYSHSKSLCTKLLSDYRDRFESALDIGCSTGWAVEHLKGQGIRAAGVDVAAKPIAEGQAKGLDVQLASAAALPFEDDSFDLVMSTDCFEHLRPEDVEASINEACRVAKRIMAFKVNPRVDRIKWWKMMAGTRLHLTTNPVSWWIEEFEKRGCTVLDLDPANEEFILSRD